MEVQLGRWEKVPGGEGLVPDHWLTGRYEANLRGEHRDVDAYLCLGTCYPGGDGLVGNPVGCQGEATGEECRMGLWAISDPHLPSGSARLADYGNPFRVQLRQDG